MRRSRLGRQPCRLMCRVEPASLSQIALGGGGTGATGGGQAVLRRQHTSASLRTEAHHTRKSSEAARGVVSRIVESKSCSFPFQFLEVLHIDTEVQSTL